LITGWALLFNYYHAHAPLMPSFRSHVFRAITKIFSARMNAIKSIPGLRAFIGTGSSRPMLPPGTTMKPARADGVSVEWMTPSNASPQSVILYLHGGGWTLGWYNSHRWMLAHICRAAACRALAVDYRLAPEDPFPAALEDCLRAYRWLLKSGTPPQQIVIAGDSAG